MAFKKLAKIYRQNKRLYLWDFDGYDHVSMGRNLQQVRIPPLQLPQTGNNELFTRTR